MPQFTNLNIPPYNDDFNEGGNYHKILFNPGKSLQSRELNQIQSISQNQIERFASYSFRQGQQVIPGELNITNNLFYVKISFVSDLTFINSEDEEVSISYDVFELINKQIRGRNSGILASVVDIKPATDETSLVLFVKYENSGFSRDENQFRQGEILTIIGEENFTPEFTIATEANGLPSTITINDVKINNPPLGLCSAVKIEEGTYYINGFFIRNKEQLVIIDEYYNRPSAKIGFLVNEEIITENNDESLYDNSRGSNNFRAPGAHRLAINLELTAYQNETKIPNNFIEIASIREGQLESQIIESIREETKEFENYIIEPFFANINENNLEVSQGAARINNNIVRNENIRRFPIKRSIETFVSNNKTINAEIFPFFEITNIIGSSPLNGDDSELTPYPNVLLYSIPNVSISSDNARKTILVKLRENEIWDPGDNLWLRISENDLIEPQELKIISYKRIDEEEGYIEITVEGSSNLLDASVINYNTSHSSYDRILYPNFETANDRTNETVTYGNIKYYTQTIFPVIGRVKPLDTKLVKKSNSFNPDKDKTIPRDSIFSFSYFDPQYLTKIV